MKNGDQPTRESRSHAGFYLRIRNRTWFWGWGSPPPAPAEQPWAAVAQWLRRLRAQTTPAGSNHDIAPVPIKDAQPAAEAGPFTPSANQAPAGERKLRFVCDRHFIGFVLR